MLKIAPINGKSNSTVSQPAISSRFIVANDGTIYDLQPTIDRINNGGTYPHRNDGTVFQNRGNLLPVQPLGTYKEYVVPTPGIRVPGALRIVTDGTNMWFTPDHYRTFIPIK